MCSSEAITNSDKAILLDENERELSFCRNENSVRLVTTESGGRQHLNADQLIKAKHVFYRL